VTRPGSPASTSSSSLRALLAIALLASPARADEWGAYELRIAALVTGTDVLTKTDNSIGFGPGLIVDGGRFIRPHEILAVHLAWTTFPDPAGNTSNLWEAHLFGEYRGGRWSAGVGLGVGVFRSTVPINYSYLISGNVEGSLDLVHWCNHALSAVVDLSGFPFNPLYHTVVSGGHIPDRLVGATASLGLAYRY